MKRTVTKDILKAIPLGGHGEIGKNCWAFEYKDEIIIVNYGFMLPGPGLSGVDLIFPNPEYLIQNNDKIKGLILTSAHDDSSGGVFYLLNKINIPKIWGPKLALETAKTQLLKDQKIPETEVVESRKEFRIGSFKITPFRTTSVLPDTYGLYIETDCGNILYSGSYKVDQTPLDGKLFDYFMYSKAGEDGVDLLITDSSNLETPGYSQSEVFIGKKFNELMKNLQSRLIVVSYASNLHKFQIIFDLAKKYNKKIFLSGEYLARKIEAGVNAGLFKTDKQILISENELQKVKDNELIIIASGKYGDFLSALMEIAKGENESVKLKPNDIVVVSSNPPPGTARMLAHIIDQLFVQKVQVIGGRGHGVHVSGHAAEEEAKFMLTITKPRCFVPSLGEERQLVKYEGIAEMMGINANDIHILKNGDIIELREQVARVAGKVPAQSIYYNHAQGLDIDEITMQERISLSKEGTIIVALALDENTNIVAGPEIIAEACAFAKGKDWRAFCLGTNELIKEAVKQSVEKKETDPANIKGAVRDTVNKAILEMIGRRPLINVSIQQVLKSLTH